MKRNIMTKLLAWILVFVIFFTLLPANVSIAKEKQLENNEKQQYIVVMKDQKAKDDFIADIKNKIKITKKDVGKLPAISVEMTETEANNLLSNEKIDYIEPDLEIQSSGEDFIPWNLEDVGIKPVQQEGLKGEGVKIAVLDTGVAEHPDLTVAGVESFVQDGSTVDENGHGTSVIGVIAATENEVGLLGAAPDAEVYSLKVMDKSGIGNISNIINAIEWCKQNDFDIINMSFGTNTYSRALEDEINSAYESGILLIAAAGNNGQSTNDNVQYPAAYNNVIAVSAVDKENKVEEFSSRGEAIELCAPGVEVYTTSVGKGYGFVSGTSYAVPHVAAVAALLWQKDKSKSNDFIRQLLNESAQDLGENRDYGNGLVDAEQALSIYSEFDTNYINGDLDSSWTKPGIMHDDREYQGDEGFVAISGVILEESRSVDSEHNYVNNTNKTYTITKNGASKIRVHFSRIDTESGHDYVHTNAGDNISGSYTDGYWSNYASGNTITVTLTSDSATTGWGFAIDKISFEDDDLPVTPYMVLVTGRTSSSISLKWNTCKDSSNNVTYDIYKKTTIGVSTKIGETTATTYNITGITDNTLKYYVVARDSYGNTSDPSKLVSASITGIPATPEFKVYKKDASGNYVQLNSGDSVPIRSYVYVTCHSTSNNYMVLYYDRGIIRRVMNPEAEDSQGGFSYQSIYITSAGLHTISLRYGDNCDMNTSNFLLNTTSTASTITYPAEAAEAVRLHFGEEGVNPATGNYCYAVTDLDWNKPSMLEGVATRYYNSMDVSNDSGLGTGWRLSFNSKITFTTGKATVVMPDGSIMPFTGTSTYTSDWTHDTLVKTNGSITYGGKVIYYLLTLMDQSKIGYDSAGRMVAKVDMYGNVTTFNLNSNGYVTKVTGPTNRYITLTYDSTTGLLSEILDDTDRKVNYYYNDKKQLVYSVSPSARTLYYAYDSSGKVRIAANLTENYGEEPVKSYFATITYTGEKVLTFKNEYGNTDTYSYSQNPTRVTRTDGIVNEYGYDTRYYITSYKDGLSATSTATYNSYGDVLNTKDRLGNTTIYSVDSKGNVTTITNPDGGKHYYKYDSYSNLICDSETDLSTNPTTYKNTTWYFYDSSGIYLQKMAKQLSDNVPEYSTSVNQDDYMITTWTYDTTSVTGNLLMGAVLSESVRVNASKTNTSTYEYSASGCLSIETDPKGNQTTYTVNDRGLVTKLVQPSGTYVIRQYDYDGNMLREDQYEANGASGGTTRTYVDLSGRTMFSVSGENYNPAYDGLFYIDDNSSANAYSVNIYYGTADATYITHTTETDSSSGISYKLDKSTAENGEVTQTLYGLLGEVKESRDANGSITIPTYDNLGRVIKNEYKESVTAAAKVTSTTAYSTVNGYTLMSGKVINAEKVISTSYLDNNTESSKTTSYQDFAGRTVKMHVEDSSSGTTKTSDMEYDYSPSGLLLTTKETTDGSIISKELTYDAAGHVIKEKVPFDIIGDTQYFTTTTYTYNSDGSVREQGVSCNAPGSAEEYRNTSYEYDGVGNVVLVKLTDGTKDNYTQYYYDELERLRRVYQGLNAKLTITGLDTVTCGADAEYSVIKYEFDNLGNLATKTDADGMVTSYISYDKDGNLTKSKDPNGNVSTYQYDNMGRLIYTETISTDATKNFKESYVYTDPVDGNPTEEVLITTINGLNDPVTTKRTFDTSHQLISELIQDTGETLDTQGIKKLYTYNLDGSTNSFTVKINNVTKLNLSYEYTLQGQLSTLKEDGATIATYQYDGAGKLASKVIGSINQSYTYNQLGAVNTATTTTSAEGTIYQETLQRNLDGNIRSIQESKSGRTQSFTYDKMGRLITAVDNGSSTSYTYDDYHNRISKGSTTYSYNTSGTRLTNSAYDNNGNTITDLNRNTFAYDGLNRMQQATVGGVTTNYSYNTDGLIFKRNNSNENVINVWDGDQLVMELDANKNVVTKYIRAFDDLIKAENGNGTLKWYYVKDTHGNVVKLLDSTYKVTKSYTYDEFGNEKNIDASDENPFRYCSEYYDKNSGTVYLRARIFSPGMGRFLQMDSYTGDYNNPLSMNLWIFCENDPIDYIDPSGKSILGARYLNVSIYGGKRSITGSTWSVGGGFFAPDFDITVSLYQDNIEVASKKGINNVSITASTNNKTSYWKVKVSGKYGNTKVRYSTYNVLFNRMGVRYPSYTDPKSKKIAFEPSTTLKKVSNPVPWTNAIRNNYRTWYESKYNSGKKLEWKNLEIHHIIPRIYGGTNNYSNLIVMPKSEHIQFTSWWAGY